MCRFYALSVVFFMLFDMNGSIALCTHTIGITLQIRFVNHFVAA